jgi:hypothetical protein
MRSVKVLLVPCALIVFFMAILTPNLGGRYETSYFAAGFFQYLSNSLFEW